MEMKTDKEPPAPESGGNADELIKRLGEWKEVAAFLRRNVVQGRMDENGTYRELDQLTVTIAAGREENGSQLVGTECCGPAILARG